MGIIEAIANGFKAVAAFFGYAQQRDSERNAPDVKAAAVAQDEVNARDKTRKAIATQDVKETRNELAE